MRASLSGLVGSVVVSALLLGCGGSTQAPQKDASPADSGAPESGGDVGGAAGSDGGSTGEVAPDAGSEVGAEAGTEAGAETAASPAKLEIVEGAAGTSFNVGAHALGSSSDQTFTVKNSGGSPATAISGTGPAASPFGPKGGAFPGTGGTCTTTLAAGASCTFVVTFSPTQAGVAMATVGLAYNDGAGSRVVALDLSGVGAAPAALVISDATAYDFGDRLLSTTAEHTFVVTNTGGVAATDVAPAALAAPLSYKNPAAAGACGTTLAAGASCTVTVLFSPAAAGKTEATLTIAFGDGLATRSAMRAIAGTGISPALIVISDGPTYDFGVQGLNAPASHTFTVENQGGAPAHGLDLQGALAAPFAFQGGAFSAAGTCGSILAAYSSCTFTVTFKPTLTGAANATLTLRYDDGLTAQATARALAGTGTDHAHLAISDAPTYDFGTHALDVTTAHNFTITNTGAVAASITSTAGFGPSYAFAGGAFPGTGGTCASSVAAGASCTMAVAFTPRGVGIVTDALTVDYDDGFGAQVASRPLTGAGTNLAFLSISDGPKYTFPTVATGATAEHTFVVTNSGQGGATALAGAALSPPFAYKAGGYPGTGGTCGATLAAGATCTVVVTFHPTGAGLPATTLSIAYNDGTMAGTATRAISGGAASPALLAFSDAPRYDFGARVVGSATERVFTVTNTGGVAGTAIAPVALNAPFAFTGGAYPGTGGSCAAALDPGQSCTLAVTFSPTAAGTASSTIALGYGDGVATASASEELAGAGLAPALLAISDGPAYDFGTRTVGGVGEHAFTVTNTGGVQATAVDPDALAPPWGWKGGAFPGAGATCGATLDPGKSCTIIVTFAPMAAGAAPAAALSLDYSDGVVARNAKVTLAGAGATRAALALSDGPTYDFGTRAAGSTTAHTFTLTNTGGRAVSALAPTAPASPFAFAGGAYPGTAGTCGSTLAAGATCTIVIAFAPVTAGTAAGTLSLSYDDTLDTVSTQVALAGKGAAPAQLAVSDGPTFDFGTKASGSTTAHTFTVINGGGFVASALAPAALTSPFAFVGGAYPGTGGTCGATLAPGTSCAVVVRFTPAASGTATDALIVGYDDGASTAVASVGLTGKGAAPALLAISDRPTYDFGTRAIGASGSHAFTVTNSGGVAATGLAGNALGAGYAYEGGAFPGAGGTCATTVAAGATCTVVVAFAPATAGTLSATLTLSYGDGAAIAAATRGLTGTGAQPAALAISDGPTYGFGTRANGASALHTFTVTNAGGVAATSLSPSAVVAPFTYAGGAFPGTLGTCGATLAAGAACTFVAAFAPTVTGPASGTVILGYQNGAAAVATSVTLTGTGAPPAALSISDAIAYDFGAVGTAKAATHVFRVENAGGTPATLMAAAALGAPYSFAGGAYPGTGGTCSTALPAGGACAIVVRFAPTVVGTFPAALSLSFDDGVASASATRPLTGKGTAAAVLAISDFPPQYYAQYALQADPPVFDFGKTGVGASNPHQFFVTNTGATQATAIAGVALGAPFSYLGGAFPGAGGNCPETLGPGVTCAVVVELKPSSAGSTTATMTISYDDGTGARNIARSLAGVGTNGPALAIWDFPAGGNSGVNIGPSWNYGVRGLGVADEHQFLVTNNGAAAAVNMTAPALGPGFSFKGGSYPGSGGSCGTTLAAGGQCVVNVAFSPAAVGPASTKVLLTYEDATLPETFEAVRQVQGVGTDLAALEVWIDNQPFGELVYDYGFHATSTATGHTFMVVNAGAATAKAISPVALPAPFAYAGGTYPGAGGTCGTSLAKGSGCTLVVVYAPTVAGTATASVAVTYDDGSGAPREAHRDVTGSATSYALLAINNWPSGGGGGQEPDPFDFGTWGAAVDHVFSLENVGAQAATSLAGIAPAAPFSFKGGSFPGLGGTCGATLAKGGSCTVVVTFSGAASGASAWSATYVDGSGATVQVTRSVTATSISTALLQITDCDQCSADTQPIDFGTTGVTTQRTLWIRNVGSQSATAIAGGAPMGDGFGYGSGSAYPGPGGTCGTTLASGQTCMLGIVFTPPSPGGHGSTLTLNYDDGTGAKVAQRSLIGTGISTALLTIRDWPGDGGGTNKAPYDYGSNGVASDHTFTVTNDGAQTATNLHAGPALGNAFAYKGGTFPGAGGSCASSLAVGASCNLVVTFTPPGTGIFSSTISVEYASNGGGQNFQAQRPVTGMGISTALLVLSQWGPGAGDSQPYDYGTFGSPSDHFFYLSNNGAIPATAIADGATLGGDFGYAGGSYPGTGGGTCGTSLAPGATCTLVVRFTPTGNGPKASTLTLEYNDGNSPNARIAKGVTGTAVSGPLVRIYDWTGPVSGGGGPPPPFDYGTWGTNVSHTFTIANDGNALAANLADGGTLGGNFSYEGGTYPGTGATCGTSLAAGASCTVNVRFSPAGSGPRSSKLTLNYTDVTAAPQPPVARDLSGTATLGALLSLWDAAGGGCGEGCGPYGFGAVKVGSTSETTFNIGNNGAVAATAMGDGGLLALPFKFKGGAYPGTGGTCTSSLAPNAACTIVVVFTPSTPTTSNGQVGVNYNDGLGVTAGVRRSLSGTGVP